MALELKLTLSAITADCMQRTLIDETVYGGANPTRDQFGVFVGGIKKGLPTEADQWLQVDSNNGNPQTDDTWFVKDEQDGWLSCPMYAVPIYNGAATYSIGQCVYHSTVFWQCLASVSGVEPGTDPAFWKQLGESTGSVVEIDVSEEEEAALIEITEALEAADNVTYEYFNFIVTCKSEKCYSKLVVGAANEGCCEGCTDAELKQTYERVDVLLNGAFSLCTQLRYAEAEEVVRNITHICEKSKCVCD